ncbi:MAG TPA: DMT family transporter [Candidatus Saccharicenans sp.]|nr:DMT family transporter [Candidatus Saccharicenans sp.]HPB59675.1 DMT family transporter [Candidatus Saccharicenans sp.]HQO76046.1 DMT family transporter [Candidatus Saccharicenans sp.]HUM78501.1 DMT family transporter [Candidatus Saccharicenans sp.]
MNAIQYSGEWLALVSAVAWAVAVILFRKSSLTVHPIGLNLGKNLLAIVLIALTSLITGASLWPAVSPRTTWLLFLSGFLGIALSDTLFLWTLKLIGASLTAIVDSVYTPFVIILSFIFLGERLNWHQLIGVALIALAVVIIARNQSDSPDGPASRRNLFLGIIMGTTGMALVAVAVIIIKPVLSNVPVVWATGVRLAGGTLPLLLLPIIPQFRYMFTPLLNLNNWKNLAPASFLGTYLSLLFWIGGIKYAFASITAALSQLSTIFVFVLAALFLKEKVTRTRILAVIMAFLGAFLAIY